MDQKFHRRLLDSMSDGVYYVDDQRRIGYWNPVAESLTGYAASEVIGRSCRDNLLMHVDDSGLMLCKDVCPLAKTISDGQCRNAEVYLHHKDGHRVPVQVRISPVRGEDGNIVGALEVFSEHFDQAGNSREVARLKQLALLDPLTGLGNRRYAEMSLNSRLAELKRNGLPFSILFMDLDDFKKINDTYGHDVGDRVLVMVARTLTGCLRSGDNVCRWGGEEFLALLPGVESGELPVVAEKLRKLVDASWLETDGSIVMVTMSIGGVTASAEDTSLTLIRQADELMYQSKAQGKNCVSTCLRGSGG